MLEWAGAAAASVMAGTALALRDASALAVAAVLAAAIVWLRLRPRGIVPAAVVVVLADVAFFTTAATLSNLRHGDGVVPVVVPGAVALASVVAFLAAVVVLAAPAPDAPARASLHPRAALRAGLATGFVVAVVMALAPRLHSGHARPGEVAVNMKTTSFSPGTIKARAGTVKVFVANRDLFWHTFTIDTLHVDLGVPVGGSRHAQFTVPAGRYVYYCRVPGHTQAGMKGVLIAG